MNVNKTELNKSNLNIIDKNNFHQKLTEFKSLISSDSHKIIILNIIDSLNLNYSKQYDNLGSKLKEAAEPSYFSNFFFPKAIEKKNSQILFFEITILFQTASESKRNSETLIIPSVKFHKFISESFLNLNPSLINFFSNNKSLFPLKALLDINTLSYMPDLIDSQLLKNFEKIRKFGKPTKNEYKKSYYFFPKGLNDPVINTKKRLEDFFKSLNSKIIEIKNDEKQHLENLAQNKYLNLNNASAQKFFFKDKFSIEKVLDFKYMYFFKKFDENFLKMHFSKYSLESLLSKKEIRLNKQSVLTENDLIQLEFTALLLKKILLDLEFVFFKIYESLGIKNEKVDEHYEKVLKSVFKDLYFENNKNDGINANNINLPFFRLNLTYGLMQLAEKGFFCEIYFSHLSEFLSKALNQKIIFSFDFINKLSDSNSEAGYLELKYFLTQAPSNENLIYLDVLKKIIKKLVYFLDNNQFTDENAFKTDSLFTDKNYSFINSLYSKVVNQSISNIKSSLINNSSQASVGNKNNYINNNNNYSVNIKNDSEIENSDSNVNLLEIDLESIQKKLSKYHTIETAESNQIILNHEMFESLEFFLPKSFLNNFSPTYEITLDFNLTCLSNIEPKKIENEKITYDSLFLKINKEKDILFDYDIETAIYKFLEHDIIQALGKNGQFDYLYYNRLSSEMKKFYADFKAFLYYDDHLKFRKRLENEVFKKVFYDFSFNNNEKINYNVNKDAMFYLNNNNTNNNPKSKNLFEFLENFEKEKNLLETKNELLMLFNETKAEFLIKEEYGLYNFVEALFNNDLKNAFITGIDINSIIIKIFNEMYVNHELIFRKDNDNKITEEAAMLGYKKTFVDKFLSKNYLDLNYLFNSQKLLGAFNIKESDFSEIVNVYFDNNYFKGRLEKKSINSEQSIDYSFKSITTNIAKFVERRLLKDFGLVSLDNLMQKLRENSCLNIFFLAKHNNSLANQKELKTFKIRDAKEITFNIELEELNTNKQNNAFVVKYNEEKKNILISHLRKFTDFYICDLKDDLTRIEICEEIDEANYKNFVRLLDDLDMLP